MTLIKHTHYIIYKPYGYLSQFVNNQNKRKNKKLLGTLFDFPENLMAIGRLDEKSEGLLLLTSDGKTSAHVRSNKVEKEYYAEVDGIVTDEAILQLQKGVTIAINGSNYTTKPCKAFKIEGFPNVPKRFVRDEKHGSTSWISITLTEGKFRQVRKMTAKVGFPTLRLVRIRIGNILLKEMQIGAVLPINDLTNL